MELLNKVKNYLDTNKLNLIFYSLEGDISLQLSETTKIKELKDLYIKEKSLNKNITITKPFVFVYKGLKIDFNSKDPISKKFQNNDTIFVVYIGENVTIEQLLEKRKNKGGVKSEDKKNDDKNDKNKDKKENDNSLNSPTNNQNNINCQNINKQNNMNDININKQNNINDNNLNNEHNVIINNHNYIIIENNKNNKNNINEQNINNQNNININTQNNRNNINIQNLNNQNNNVGIPKINNKDKKYIDMNNDILEFMIQRSFFEKEKIHKNKRYKKSISIKDCLTNKDIHYTILGILAKYLEKIGINTAIECDDNPTATEEDLLFFRKLFQFIYTGYIFKNKYILDFNLGKKIISKLEKDPKEKEKFNKKLEDAVIKVFKLEKDEFIVTNYKKDKNIYTVIIVVKSNKILTKKKLLDEFKNAQELNTCKDININLFLPSLGLSKSMLCPQADNFNDKYWGRNQKRGGEDYIPPLGWFKFGLKVFNCYDNKDNSWLGSHNSFGEWCIAYYGFTGINKTIEQKYENDNDIKNPGKKVGIGVYCTPNPSFMEQNTEIINLSGNKFKIGFMIRIKPDKIRSPQSNKDIWVVDGTDDDFRPYGILLKQIK